MEFFREMNPDFYPIIEGTLSLITKTNLDIGIHNLLTKLSKAKKISLLVIVSNQCNIFKSSSLKMFNTGKCLRAMSKYF